MKKIFVFTCILVLLFPIYALGADVTLGWGANIESDLAGYKVYYKVGSKGEPYDGIGAIEGDSPVVVPLSQLSNPADPEFTLHGLNGSLYYCFVVTAYDNETPSLESDYSNEVCCVLDEWGPPKPPQNLFIKLILIAWNFLLRLFGFA